MIKHAFVVCAYKESEYLEACIKSLKSQTVKTDIIICTSTPNLLIRSIARKYKLPLFVRKGASDIQEDWNFACEQIDADWVTVAHQDDIYHSKYAEYIIKAIEKNPEGIMAFSDYRPVFNSEISIDLNCRIRHLLRSPMKVNWMSKSKFWKKYCLSLGNCICCPAVCYHKSIIDGPIFTSKLKFSLDWDTYLKFALMDGKFIYVDKPLTYYRIHDKATTMDFIQNDTRHLDDEYMFNQFWPKWITKIIMVLYRKSYATYHKKS